MTATEPGWYDASRQRELAAVVGLISLPRAYRASPTTVSWEADLPGDCTELTALAEGILTELGWPPECLERWACDIPGGKRHAVLVANLTLSDGTVSGVAIDCRHPTPQLMSGMTHYTDWVRL